MTYRLIEYRIESGIKQINNLFEHDDRSKLIRHARKQGIKIRGNANVVISEVPYEPDCD